MNPILPEALLQSLEGIRGFQREAFEKIHASGEQLTSVRVNPFKWPGDPAGTGLPIAEKIPWNSRGYYLSQRPSFTLDPLFHAGCYYVQEASSTFLEQALKQTLDLTAPLRVLDLCAAPGGKSTLIQSLLSRESLLVSNEVIRTRVHVLLENMIKWGTANCFVSNNDPEQLGKLTNYFDAIIVDAPCSGSGLFRRDPEAILEWKPELVKLCSQRQQRILADVWPALKRGGILIYSTCSYSKEENEDILDWMMSEFNAENLRLEISNVWSIVETVSRQQQGFGYRFYPDQVKGEGLYMTCLRKPDGDLFNYPKSKKNINKLSRNEETIIQPYLADSYPLAYLNMGDRIHALPPGQLHDLLFLQQSLYLKKVGLALGKLAGTELIPDHELAMDPLLNRDRLSFEVDREMAVRYLRKEDIRPETTNRGWALVTYQQKALGWIKILPNRVNTYYPKEWRILQRNQG